jgi:hypothetical protein
VARELAEETKTSQGTVSEGFRDDLTLLESVIRDAAGPKADANTVRLDALSVLNQCVFYCAARRTLTRFSPKLDQPALKPQRLVRHLTLSSLRGIGDGARLSRTRLKASGTDMSVLLQNTAMEKPVAAR